MILLPAEIREFVGAETPSAVLMVGIPQVGVFADSVGVEGRNRPEVLAAGAAEVHLR